MSEGVALERRLFFPLYDTKGMQEGVSAFVEKRKPNMKDLWWYADEFIRLMNEYHSRMSFEEGLLIADVISLPIVS